MTPRWGVRAELTEPEGERRLPYAPPNDFLKREVFFITTCLKQGMKKAAGDRLLFLCAKAVYFSGTGLMNGRSAIAMAEITMHRMCTPL